MLCLKSEGWKISDMYSGDKLLKNLNMPTQIYCKAISFVGVAIDFLEFVYIYLYGLCYQAQTVSDTFIFGYLNIF